jgi:hypothetical protein
VTLPARDGAVSPSFAYLGSAQPATAKAPSPAAPVQAALQYPAPLSAALTTPGRPQAAPAAPQIALHYPAPLSAALKAPNAPTQKTPISASIVAMGEPAVEYFKVAAISPRASVGAPNTFSPMVMRGGMLGDAILRDSGSPARSETPQQASVSPEKRRPVPRDAPPPAPLPAAAPPPPPKGLAPVGGVGM